MHREQSSGCPAQQQPPTGGRLPSTKVEHVRHGGTHYSVHVSPGATFSPSPAAYYWCVAGRGDGVTLGGTCVPRAPTKVPAPPPLFVPAPLAIFEPSLFTPNPMGGHPSHPFHARRIPSSKSEQVRAPGSTTQHSHSALMTPTHSSWFVFALRCCARDRTTPPGACSCPMRPRGRGLSCCAPGQRRL